MLRRLTASQGAKPVSGLPNFAAMNKDLYCYLKNGRHYREPEEFYFRGAGIQSVAIPNREFRDPWPHRHSSFAERPKWSEKLYKTVNTKACGICFRSLDAILKENRQFVEVNCGNGHQYCLKCIEESYRSKRECPQCQEPLHEKW